MTRTFTVLSELETRNAAREFSKDLRRGDVVALYGDLGAGKTQFVKGLCEAFHVRSHVASPSFIILNRYLGYDENGEELMIHHFDLYRIRTIEEVYDLGYEELFFSEAVSVVEWAEKLETLLPPVRYDVTMLFGDREGERRISIVRVPESAQTNTMETAIRRRG